MLNSSVYTKANGASIYNNCLLLFSVDENGICENLQIGVRADFNITLSLLQCSDAGQQM